MVSSRGRQHVIPVLLEPVDARRKTVRSWPPLLKAIVLGIGLTVLVHARAVATELKIFAPRSMWTVLNEIGPPFEARSGYKLAVITDIAANLADRIIQREPFDIFIGPPVQLNRIVENNKVLPDTRTAIAHSGIGVEVRTGARKPDIDSLEAFKAALLDAKSVGYLRQDGTSGAYLHALFERLGILEEIKPKALRPETDIVSELVAKGEIELGIVVITQIVTTPGVELVGPIPSEIQHYIRWSGAVSANSAAAQAARDLLKYLTSEKVLPVFKAQGMEPG
jgi:molybdate transport system substrate-binding protein